VRWIRAAVAVGLIVTGCSDGGSRAVTPATTKPPVLKMRVVATHPHDPTAFTEGYVFADRNHLYESSGLYGQSRLSSIDPTTGTVNRTAPLDPAQFGEGLASVRGELVQLTWKEGVALRWATATLSPVGRYALAGEGWGLTYDAARGRYIQSDGTGTLTFRDRSTFAVTGHVDVTRAGKPVTQLNELEWVAGTVWANVWLTNEILRIDPRTGRVTGVVDVSSLVPANDEPDNVPNGIAHRPGDAANRLWVTGKRWPTATEITVS